MKTENEFPALLQTFFTDRLCTSGRQARIPSQAIATPFVSSLRMLSDI